MTATTLATVTPLPRQRPCELADGDPRHREAVALTVCTGARLCRGDRDEHHRTCQACDATFQHYAPNDHNN